LSLDAARDDRRKTITRQAGGELMWIGGSAIMFAGFMLLAFEYARHEIRLAS
jgi:hypothetical protein